jgi:Transmembrane protein 43
MADGGFDAGSTGGGGNFGGGGNTVVTTETWFSRIGNAFKGILVGIVLFLGSFVLLFLNEGYAVRAYKALKEGKDSVVSIPTEQIGKVDPGNEGKLVHLSGKATSNDTVRDPDFGIEKGALRLERHAEIYQWQQHEHTETVKQTGGSEKRITTYTYTKEWSPTQIDSGKFHIDREDRQDHVNRGALEFASTRTPAAKVTVGAFVLSPALIAMIPDGDPLKASDVGIDAAKPEVKKNWKVAGDYFYRGDPANSAIGDQRIKFTLTMPQDVSLYAQQAGDSFKPFKTSTDIDLLKLKPGIESAAKMFVEAQGEQDMWTWGLRLGGFVLMAIGIALIFQPFVVFADVLPIAGNILSMGVAVFAALVALPLTLITIAIAWIVYRPVLGISLLVAAAVVLGLTFASRRRRPTSPAALASLPTVPTQPPPR